MVAEGVSWQVQQWGGQKGKLDSVQLLMLVWQGRTQIQCGVCHQIQELVPECVSLLVQACAQKWNWWQVHRNKGFVGSRRLEGCLLIGANMGMQGKKFLFYLCNMPLQRQLKRSYWQCRWCAHQK